MSGQPQVGWEWPLTKRRRKFTSKPRTKKQKRVFDEITETLRRARVLAAKTALPKSAVLSEFEPICELPSGRQHKRLGAGNSDSHTLAAAVRIEMTCPGLRHLPSSSSKENT